MCLRKYIKSLKWKWLISHIPHSLKIEFSWGIANPTWCPWTRLRTWDYWLASPIFLSCPLVQTTMKVRISIFLLHFWHLLGSSAQKETSSTHKLLGKKGCLSKKGSHHYAWHKSGPTLSRNAESPPRLAWADFKIKVKQIAHSTVYFDQWNPPKPKFQNCQVFMTFHDRIFIVFVYNKISKGILVTIKKELGGYFQWLHFWNHWVPLKQNAL